MVLAYALGYGLAPCTREPLGTLWAWILVIATHKSVQDYSVTIDRTYK